MVLRPLLLFSLQGHAGHAGTSLPRLFSSLLADFTVSEGEEGEQLQEKWRLFLKTGGMKERKKGGRQARIVQLPREEGGGEVYMESGANLFSRQTSVDMTTCPYCNMSIYTKRHLYIGRFNDLPSLHFFPYTGSSFFVFRTLGEYFCSPFVRSSDPAGRQCNRDKGLITKE